MDFDQLFRNADIIKIRTLTTALQCHLRHCYTRQFFVELDSQRLKKLRLSVLMLCAPVFIFIVQLLSSFSAPTLWFIDLTVFVVVVVLFACCCCCFLTRKRTKHENARMSQPENARQVAVSVCYTWQFLVQLASQQNCETSSMKNCLV